jgi:hypothetical protein
MIAIVVLAISICFVFLVYKNSTSKQLKLVNTAFGTSELILISFATSFLIYLTFFHYADYIRSLNVKVPHDRFIPPARAASYEFDGIEGYVLYSL